jgi:hypothetical protein
MILGAYSRKHFCSSKFRVVALSPEFTSPGACDGAIVYEPETGFGARFVWQVRVEHAILSRRDPVSCAVGG